MYSRDIDYFVQRNLLNFKLNGKGWHDLIKKMLFEFCIAGWDINNDVSGKEKYGTLRCYIVLDNKDLEQKIKTIVQAYAHLSGKTCEKCGANGKERNTNGWTSILCKNCYLEETKSISLKKENNLEECKICGYFSLEEGKCKFCGNVDYNTNDTIYSPKKYFKSEIEYIKECQIEIFLDKEDEIEVSKRTKGYSKSQSHQILFTFEELDTYRKSNQDELNSE
ncbi:hypothetical protein ABH942_001532 [Flavobacterium sp. 28YEA47A]|uniref:hypothetical protein n=1 Tax=Flavobacterium sp. 28YEA47A TaxID=3156276 RepID=UPI003515FBC9